MSAERMGILTRPAFRWHILLHIFVKRGMGTRANLCEELNPPPDVDMEIPPPENDMQTIRDRLAIHSENPVCQGCHQRIDPVGFSFENYGALGEYRQTWENGITVDATGSLPEGEFNHAVEMLQLLGNLERAKTCYVQNWMEYALGRPLETQDQCTLERLTKRFIASDGHLPSLIIDIASSDSFLYTRKAP